MTPTARLRERVRDKIAGELCPQCRRPTAPLSLRAAAESVGHGVTPSVLSRFLNGRTINSDTYDALDAWVNG